ncbi:Crp/Fnr family transcriptional regulator [Caproiciproducens galactitolivorans]|uniref:Transcriptional activator FtrB n=1 Tax=Caproiciproducens galactitolivorans TaxID=642589 RepID=A0A4Z0YBV7_9FIRM|nr:Crp/Fnr family transcriptional regulator [Caproiciproducens galactitolivorans]QEY34979.1 Crp/Fnr family transcriptional regulator [Caproiciproducens galactitolivorans]TGJ76313.1 transcriptional activator FtrB [Caproiciproducens galactitolivorans]
MAIAKTELEFMKEALPFWNALSQNQKERIEATASAFTVKKGQSLHDGSQDCLGLILVKSGHLRAYILSDTGKEITIYRLFERDACIFSAACMLKNITFDISIEAESESRVLLIPTAVYNELNESTLAVSGFTNQLISSRFSDVMWIMEQVLFTSFDRRLANFLLEQSAVEGSDTLHITQEAIANHLGSAREVVTRMLKYFQSEGMVSLFRGGVTISSRKKLEKLSEK